MGLELPSGSADSHAQESHHNLLSLFGSGFGEALAQPVTGLKQLVTGDAPSTSTSQTQGLSGVERAVEVGGNFVGNAVLFLGSAALASRIPGVGKLAPIAVGGALGFLSPTKDNSMLARVENAAVGAGSIAMLEHGPLLLQNKLANSLVLSGATGAAFTQANSLINEGHTASLMDTGIGAASWAGTSLVFHGLGRSFSKGASESSQPETARSRALSQLRSRQAGSFPGAESGVKLSGGDYTLGLESDGRARSFDVHVPAAHDGTKPLPVMLVLDGVNTNQLGVRAAESQMNALADTENFAVVYPYALDGHKLGGKVAAWNSEGTGLTNHVAGYDDANFIDAVIADVRTRIPVDTSRIYGVGFSEGGMLLNHYQTTRPGTFAGLGLVHATMNGSEGIPLGLDGKPVPTNAVIVHSTNDYMLPYKGGRGLISLPFAKFADSKPSLQAPFWAEVNDSLPPAKQHAAAYDQTDYVSRDGQHQVREYIVKGGNHAWDGSPLPGWPIVGRPSSQFSTTQALWNFLKDKSLVRSLTDDTVVPLRSENKVAA